MSKLSDNERWLLSFYRTSEISGALFFGRLAKYLKSSEIQHDMTKHFADESQHAWYWTKCIDDLGSKPIKLEGSYQEQYLAAAGMPVNIMEILAITQVFERRVIGQYGLHRQTKDLHPTIAATIDIITEDEKWHIEWVNNALKALEPEYGKDHINETIRRYWNADKEVYKKILTEHDERITDILGRDIAHTID